jgi:hypothetical protein
MKFVSLRKDRTHRQGRLEKPSSATVEFLTKPMALPHQIRTYTQLLQQIHHELRIQHPEWVQSNGESPMCDTYELRLTELLETLTRRASSNAQRGRTI